MLAEYLEGVPAPWAVWEGIMPGARACRFSLGRAEGPLPAELVPRLERLRFEALFCLGGRLTLERRDGAGLSAGARELLLLSDASGLAAARFEGPAAGILVAVDGADARESLRAVCRLLGGLELDTGRVRRRMEARGGCALVGSTAWSQAAFDHLDRLPPAERGRYCVLKSVELLYLLCAQEGARRPPAGMDRGLARAVADVRAYMEAHLEEKLTIPGLCRQFRLSSTAFKACFRRMYGQPVHAWLRARRVERAAELLRSTSMGVLEVSQAVGYGSASQFGSAFRARYGVSPGQYRKMSELGEI